MTSTHRTGRLDRDRTTVHRMENSMSVIATVCLMRHDPFITFWFTTEGISFSVHDRFWIVARAYSKYVQPQIEKRLSVKKVGTCTALFGIVFAHDESQTSPFAKSPDLLAGSWG